MSIEKTDTIILKSFHYGDTSKIARCYTRDFGKISIIGKGVRKSKTLQSGYFEPMNYLSLLFYHNPKRQLQIFSKAEYRDVWQPLKSDVKKMSYGFAVVELVDRSVTGEEPHEELFQLVVEILQAINDSNGNINLIFWYFEMKLLSLLGFRPGLSKCPRCDTNLTIGYFSGEYGELQCRDCFNKGQQYPDFVISDSTISHRSLKILKILKQGNLEDVGKIVLQSGDRRSVGVFINNYLRFHIEGLNEIRSLKVLGKIVNNSASGSK